MFFLSLLPYKITYFYFYGSYQLASLSQDTVSAFITYFTYLKSSVALQPHWMERTMCRKRRVGAEQQTMTKEFRETKISGFPRAL